MLSNTHSWKSDDPMKTLLSVALLALTVLLAHAEPQATFPTRTVTLVAPYTANSGSDIISRLIAPKLAARWHQAVIVDNRPGASGNLGANFVVKAAPDGHTLLMAINTYTMTPALYKAMPFDPVADLAPVTRLAQAGFVLAVNPAVPVSDLQTLFAYIKKNPGKLNFASPGKGTPQHLAMELLKARYGLDIVHVPYKGISGALTDLMGGEVQIMFGTVHSMRPYEQSGKLRFLAVTGPARQPLAPAVPTFHEQGIDAADRIDAWYGVLVPARTAPALVARLNADFSAVMNAVDTKAELAKLGLTVGTGTPAQFGALIQGDLVRWRKVVGDAGIAAE